MDIESRSHKSDRQSLQCQLEALARTNESLKRELQEVKQRHRDQLNGLSDGLYTLDVEGNITYLNRTLERMSGLNAKEILGCHYSHCVDPSVVPKLEAGRQRVLGGETVCHEVELDVRGMHYCMELHAGPIWQGDRIVGSQGIVRDITARKRVEQDRRDSRRFLDSLFNAISDFVLLVNSDGYIRALNQTAAQHLGGSPEDLIGRHIKDFFPAEIVFGRESKGREALDSGQIVRFIDDWDRGTFDITMYPSLDTESEEGQLVVFARDITQQRQAEQALIESECRYRCLLEGASEAIAMHDDQGRILFLNQFAASKFGGCPSDFVGKTIADVLDEPYASMHLQFFQRVIRSGKSETSEQYLVNPQGEPVWLNMTVIPLQGLAKDKKTVIMLIAQDITPLKKAQEELELFRNKMARAERLASAGTLSAMVAHEFAQPLTVMRLSVQNALASLNKGQPDWLKGDLQDCLKEISNVSVILDRFRSFAKLALERENEVVPLGSLIGKTVTLFQDSAKSLAITLNEESLEGIDTVWGCEKDLEQLFFILIENSLQALQGKRHGQLHISAELVDPWIRIQLSDTCGGIAPEHMARIFDPFFTTKVHQQGTGLGLCIVQRILEETGGSIAVDNRPGEGVTFTVTLPVVSS